MKSMDFHCMKRKQLQALCKKHGVSANLSNREMADRLSSIFKKNKIVEKSSKKVSESGSKVVKKKVRFSPENETFIYEVSGYKRGGRRSSMRLLTRKQIPPSTSRKRARRDDVEAKSDVEKRTVTGRGSKKAKNGVSEHNEEFEETGKGKGRLGVGMKKRSGGSKVLAGDGGEQGVVRGNGEPESEMVIRRKTRSQAKIASEGETEEPFKKRRVGRRTLAVEIKDGGTEMSSVEHEEPLKDVGRYASRRKTQKGKEEIGNVEVEAAGKTSKEIDKVENVTGPSRRTRCSTLKSVLTVGELETVEETRKSKRTRNSKTKVEAASRLEAIEESSKESDKVVNVSLPIGPSRRTRRNTIIFASEGKVETNQPVRVEDGGLSKGHLRRSSRNASRSNSILTTEGIASGVGKGKQQKQRRKQIIDEDISTSKCKPLAENPPRQSSRVTSKSDSVKPAGPTNKVVGKKRHNNRSRIPVIEESPSERFSASKEPLIEDSGLAAGEAERATNNQDASYSKQVLESSNKFLSEPSNIFAREKAIEAEEPSNVSHRNDNADDHLNKDDRTSVDEHQTLVHSENAEETADTVIQEVLLEENLNERSSGKMLEVLREKAEEISVEAVEMQEIAAESNLGVGESSAIRTAEMQLSTNGGNATKATPSRPALETEGFDNEVNNDPDHTLVANNVDSTEGACNTEAQNVFQSTELEGGDTHSIGEEEFSGIGMDSGKFICIGESSVSNAWDGDDVSTTNNIQCEETFYNERTSLVLGEKITEEDYNMNLLVGDSTITCSVKRKGGDTEKKEKQVLELYAEDAVETENEVSEKRPNNFSGENRGRCMHEPLEAEEIDLIITEERGSDVVNDTSVACIDLQSPFTGDKEICLELALLENELINDEHETDIGTKKLPSFRARLSVHNDMQDKLKSKLNEEAMDVLIAGVQTGPLSQFALGKLQNSMKNGTQDASNGSCEVLCQPIGDCSSGSRTEVLDSDLVGEKSSSVATREIDKEADVKLYADVAQEKNLEGALKVELDANVHNLETKDIDEKGFDGESDVEECADVVKEENADCVLEVEFGDKNDLERMPPQIIVKESEFSDDKGVEIMIAPGECIERIDMLKMEESTFKNRNSDAVVMDVGSPSPVIANHSVEMEGADVDDSSILNGEIATDRETGTETVKRLPAEVDNGGTSARVSPTIPGKAFKDEFTEINAAASGALSEIISAPCEDLEEKSVEVLGPGQCIDEVKLDNVKDSEEENVMELKRYRFVASNSNDSDTDRKANIEMIAGDSNFDFNRSDDVKEDNTDIIPQVSTNDIDDRLLEVEFHNASQSDDNVMSDDAGEAFDFENVEDGINWVQKTPAFSQTIEDRRKWSMKNPAKGKCYVDSSSDKPKMGSNTAALSHSMVMPSIGVTENKSLELHDDLLHLTSPEVNMTLMVGKQVEVEKSAGGNLEANLITRDREEALEVKENPTNDEQVNHQVTEKQLGELEHQLHLTVSDEPLHITHDLVDVLEAKESITTNEQVNQQVKEKQLGEQGSQSHLFVSDEYLKLTQDREDSLEVNENVTTDEHITKKQLVEQENQSYLAASDEPIRDDEETNEQNGQSAVNQECNDNDFHKASYVSAEKVILKDATQTSGSNVDDSDMFNAEHGSHDSRKADTIAIDSAVHSVSGSKGVAADEEVNIEGDKKMDMLEEIQNGRTWLPIMPVERYTDQENPEEASPGIAGTVLQMIFSSSSGREEKNVSENRLFSQYKFPASSSVSYLCDLSFCNQMHMKDSDNTAGGEMVDDDTGKNHRDVALPFQEDKDSAVGKSEATESFSLEHNRTDTQEAVKEQLGENESNRKDATCPDNIYRKALNLSPTDSKSQSYVVEADGLGHLADGVVTAGNSKEIAGFDSFTGASSLVPEMVVDRSYVSPIFDFSNSEHKVEPATFTAREINLLTGLGEQEEIENSDAEASETYSTRYDAGEVNENVATLGQVAPQVTEQVRLSGHKTTKEVAKFESDFVEGSKEQKHMLDTKHGTPDHKNYKNESLKLKRKDLAPSRDAAAGDLWRWELDKKSPDVKSVENFWLAKKTNSSMKTNSSVSKQSNRSSLIQTTPKQFVHDMKENNVLGTKRDFSSATAHKPVSKRRPLEDIRKD